MRQTCAHDLGGATFMRVVQMAVQKANGDRLHAFAASVIGSACDCVLIQRDQHRAGRRRCVRTPPAGIRAVSAATGVRTV